MRNLGVLPTFAVNNKQVHVQYLWSEAAAEHHHGGTSRAVVAHQHPTSPETILKKLQYQNARREEKWRARSICLKGSVIKDSSEVTKLLDLKLA